MKALKHWVLERFTPKKTVDERRRALARAFWQLRFRALQVSQEADGFVVVLAGRADHRAGNASGAHTSFVSPALERAVKASDAKEGSDRLERKLDALMTGFVELCDDLCKGTFGRLQEQSAQDRATIRAQDHLIQSMLPRLPEDERSEWEAMASALYR